MLTLPVVTTVLAAGINRERSVKSNSTSLNDQNALYSESDTCPL